MTSKKTAPTTTSREAERELKKFVDKFEPRMQKLIRDARKVLRRRMPNAYELVYDNYNFFVIGYSPTERPSDAVLSIASSATGLNLCFLKGAALRDPHKLLSGGGKQTRFMRIESADVIGRPEVEELVAAAIAQSKPIRAEGRGQLVIRSVSAKQRPRQRVNRGKTAK